MAQAVSRWPLTTEDRIRVQVAQLVKLHWLRYTGSSWQYGTHQKKQRVVTLCDGLGQGFQHNVRWNRYVLFVASQDKYLLIFQIPTWQYVKVKLGVI
jgi:hypothetical protein